MTDNTENQRSNFNINFSGNTVGRDVNVYNISRDLNITNNSTPQEIVTNLQKINNAIAQLKDIPAECSTLVQQNIKTAISESNSPKPDAKKVADHLNTASKTLEAASKTAGSALVFVEAIKKVIAVVAAVFVG